MDSIRFPDIVKLHDLKTRNIVLDHEKKCKSKIEALKGELEVLRASKAFTATKAYISKNKKRRISTDTIDVKHKVSDIEAELKRIESSLKDSTSMLTNYLLDAHPILNEHLVNRRDLDKAKDEKTKRVLISEKIEICNRYLRKFYPEKKKIDPSAYESGVSNKSKCCEMTLMQTTEGHLICPSCGLIVQSCATSIANPHRNVSYNRSITKSKVYSYKKLNHFREFLREIQGESKGQVPRKVMDTIRMEVKKNRLYANEVTPKVIRKFLKRNNLQRYYEHSLSIAACLNKEVEPVKLSPMYQEKLCLYFVNLEDPFERIKGRVDKSRRNFLSYSYTFCRLNQLLGNPQYNKHIQILKSVRLVQVQDRYWKLLCEELQWPYMGRMHSA